MKAAAPASAFDGVVQRGREERGRERREEAERGEADGGAERGAEVLGPRGGGAPTRAAGGRRGAGRPRRGSPAWRRRARWRRSSAARPTRYGTVSGLSTHWARTPAISAPEPIPPMLAAMPTTSARRALAGAGAGVQLGDPGGGGRGDRADGEAVEHPGDEQPGQVAPEHEGHGGQRGQGQARQQHALASVDVGEVADEEQRDRDPDGVGGEDGGDRERSEPVARGVEAVERRRECGVRHHDHQGERDRPEPAVVVEELVHAHTLAHATIAFNACLR